MRQKVLILIAVLLMTNYVKAQINANPDPDGPVWMTGDCNPLTVCSFDDIPVLHLSDTSQNTQLPLRVRNDTLKFFPPIYDQGNVCCCTFASETGYIFTYEMNRIRDEEHREPTYREMQQFLNKLNYINDLILNQPLH